MSSLSSQSDVLRTRGVAMKVTAACFAMAAFAVAVTAGLVADVDAARVLMRALLSMLVCYPVGLAVGWMLQRVIDAHIEAHKAAHPVPDAHALPSSSTAAVNGHDSAAATTAQQPHEEAILV